MEWQLRPNFRDYPLQILNDNEFAFANTPHSPYYLHVAPGCINAGDTMMERI